MVIVYGKNNPAKNHFNTKMSKLRVFFFISLYLYCVITIYFLTSTTSHYGDPWGFHAIKTLTMNSDNVADQFSLKLFKCIIYI